MAKPSANLRLFVAIYPPPETARQLSEALKSIDLPAHRVTPIEQLHLTLQFIGDTPAAQMDATIESVQRSASGIESFSLTPMQLIVLPERSPARLVAAETDAPPSLLELQRRLAIRLARNVRSRPGERYRPHLTLCRFRAPAQKFKLERRFTLVSFVVDKILLMRSTLGQEGAVHVEVARISLANRQSCAD